MERGREGYLAHSKSCCTVFAAMSQHIPEIVTAAIQPFHLQETFKVASYDDTIMMRTKQKAMQNHIKKMQLLFEEADTSADGKIDLDACWQKELEFCVSFIVYFLI